MSYAIIKVGGKQYRVQEGEKLLVDRVKTGEGETFTPELLFVPSGDGAGVTVTARVVGHVKGKKLRIGKYRKRTGYKRHTGFRASLTQIEIQSIAGGGAATQRRSEPVAAVAPEAAASSEAPAPSAPAGLPEGYDDLKVADIATAVKGWDHATLEAALAYEQEHAKRKGAISALESALSKDEEG